MLTELTEAQKAKIPEYFEEQLARSKSTKEADWADAEAIIHEVWTVSGMEPGEGFEVLRAASPVAAAIMGHKKAFAIDGVGGTTLFQSATYGGLSARNEFFVKECGVDIGDKDRQRQLLSILTGSVGGLYPHGAFVILYDRPAVLKLQTTNGTGVLHCEEGPALAWGRGPDGQYDPDAKDAFALYYWQGTEVPRHWIMDKPGDDPEKMKARAAEVLQTENQEQMRAGCEILGWVPVLEALGMRVLDSNPNPIFGRLVAVDLPSAPDSRFLVAECGTGRTVAVPASREAKTAEDAGALSYNVPVEVYKTMKVRT